MLFRTLIMFHICVAFPLKCPKTAQWQIRGRSLCLDPSKYSCLRNDHMNGYSENCFISDFLQPGRKHVLRGGLDADICSQERYQPWPMIYHTNVSTNCIFLKSTCYEEGQVIHTYGDRTTDTSCRCDYTRGYDFVVKPRNPCFCIPSIEDCLCYLKTCPKLDEELSQDYKCRPEPEDETFTVSECEPIIYRRDRMTLHKESTKIHNTLKMQARVIITMCIGLIVFLWIVIFLITDIARNMQLNMNKHNFKF